MAVGRRPQGTGGLSQREDGRWSVTYRIDGTRYSTTATTRERAERWIAQHLREGRIALTLNERWIEVISAARRNGDPDLLSALHQFAITWKGFKP